MLTVSLEPISSLLSHGLELILHAHWRETSIDQEAIPLAVDWSRLFSLEHDGYFRVFGLRRNGELIGYAAFVVAPHSCFRNTLHANCNGIYVKPEHRGYAGGRLLQGTEEILAGLGVAKIIHQVPVARGKKLSALLGRLGYAHTEDFFCKLVG